MIVKAQPKSFSKVGGPAASFAASSDRASASVSTSTFTTASAPPMALRSSVKDKTEIDLETILNKEPKWLAPTMLSVSTALSAMEKKINVTFTERVEERIGTRLDHLESTITTLITQLGSHQPVDKGIAESKGKRAEGQSTGQCSVRNEGQVGGNLPSDCESKSIFVSVKSWFTCEVLGSTPVENQPMVLDDLSS